MNLSDYPKEYYDSIQSLIQYYDLSIEQIQDGLSTYLSSEGDVQKLKAIYQIVGPGKKDEETILTLQLLINIVKNIQYVNPYTAEVLKEQMKRRDLLRLLILCNTTKTGDVIIIKNRSRSFQLHNDANWFIQTVIKPIIIKELGDSITISQATEELEKATTRHRGRRAKDPQMLKLIWGTYRLISNTHSFRTPMPNTLCNFIIKLLILMDILPENTEIDAFWIRAQLRYMKSKER